MPEYDVPEDVASNDEKLMEMAKTKFGSTFQNVEITPWTFYSTDIVPSHSTDRVVVFRPQSPNHTFGCIRVRKKGNNEKDWDLVAKETVYMGLVGADCRFEAMDVELKLITPK